MVVVEVPGAEPWSSAGHGPRGSTAVVLVHGLTSTPAATRPLGQRLAAEGYAVEVPLLPGHGTGVRDLGRTRYPDMAEAIEALLDQLGSVCDRVVLLGHSVGASIVLDLASRRPGDVDGVVVINPMVLLPSQPLAPFSGVIQHIAPYAPRDLIGMPTNDIARPDADERAYPWVPAKTLHSVLRELPRIRSQLRDLVQPLLVVWSPQDHTIDPASAQALPELVGSEDVRELVCDRSYHLPQIDYDAARVEQTLLAFLDEVHER